MLLPTASTCSPSITFSTIHSTDKRGLEKFSECLKEAFEYHYGYDESILQIDEQLTIHQDFYSDFPLEQFSQIEKNSPSTVRESASSFETNNGMVTIISDDEEVVIANDLQSSQPPPTINTFKYVN